MTSTVQLSDYLRETEFPTIWCPGCGHGIVVNAAIRAVAKLGWKKDDVVAVAGIGCPARAPVYCDFNGIQTTHGRAIAFATGMKLYRPEMHVLLFSGDGDCVAIGGNHFLHGARRNIDLTVIVMNNYIYGMTGGQVSPTTPYMAMSTTTPFGNVEPQMNLCDVAQAAGATFVARTTAYHVNQLATFIERGMKNKGFSVIECITPCPTGFGRRNKFKTPVDMYKWLRDSAVSIEKAKKLSTEEVEGKIVVGVFKDVTKPEFVDEYKKMVKRAQESAVEEEGFLEMVVSQKLENLERCEIRLSGSGGQGLILAGIILAEAGIRQGRKVVHFQSYGPEARGGASRSEVILSDEEINFPQVLSPDILLTMTQQSCDEYAQDVKPGGIILADSTFVERLPEVNAKAYKAPITKIAIDKLGSAMMANVVALGMLARISGLLSVEALKGSILNRVPADARNLNIKAFKEGYEYEMMT